MECMEDSTRTVDSEFRKMIGLQVGALVSWLMAGALFAVLTRPYIMDVLPVNEWSPIVGWAIAVGVGYVAGGVIVRVVAMFVFYNLVSDW